MKRKYALTALVGALVLPLCSCVGSKETIEKKAYLKWLYRNLYLPRPVQ